MLITKTTNTTHNRTLTVAKAAPRSAELGPQVGQDRVTLSSDQMGSVANHALRGLAATGVVTASSAIGSVIAIGFRS